MKVVKTYGLLLLLGALLSGPAALAGPVAPPTSAEGYTAALKRPDLPDTLRVQYLAQLGLLQSRSDFDAGLRTMRQGLALAQRSRYRLGEVLLLGSLSDMETLNANYVVAHRLAEQALALNRVLHRPRGIALAYARLAKIAVDQDAAPQALFYYELAERTYAAMPAAQRAAQWDGQSKVYLGLGEASSNRRQYAAALRWLRQGLALAAPAQPSWWLWQAEMLEELGNTYLEMGRLDSAHRVLGRGLRLAVANPEGMQAQVNLRRTLGRLALAEHRPAEAYAQLHQALRLAQEMGDDTNATQILLFLSQAMHALRQPTAYDSLARYMTLRDSFDAETNSQVLLTMQARFRDAEQQGQIRNLEKDRRLAAQTQELTRLRTRYQLGGLGGGALLLLLLGGGLFWRYRQRQAVARLTAAAALRTRLAADLHDDVGNLLTQISMQSGLLRESPLMPAPLLARVEALTSTARRATQQMSDAIWGLSATAPTLPDLLRHMRDHAHEVLQPLGLEPRFDTHPAVPALTLSIEARQALYLIFKEALHNIVKHAHPSEVLISLAPTPSGGLALTVRNDGPTAATPARPEGQGLASMQVRAAAVGGRVQYPTQATGFVVEAVV